jgi:hypothetical protein
MSQENSEENSEELVPQPNGKGALLKGGVVGNRGGTGRPKSEIRRACAEAFDSRIPRLLEIMDNASTPQEYMKALDLLGKYGGLQQIDATSGDNPLQGLTDTERIERIASLINLARARGVAEPPPSDALDVQPMVSDPEAEAL